VKFQEIAEKSAKNLTGILSSHTLYTMAQKDGEMLFIVVINSSSIYLIHDSTTTGIYTSRNTQVGL